MTNLGKPNPPLAMLRPWTLACAGLLALAGCGGDDGPMTMGEFCSRMAGPTCDRAIECNLGPASDRKGCLAAFKEGCCGEEGRCGEEAPSKEAEAQLEKYISVCSAAFADFSCTSLEAGQVPDACTTVSPSVVTPMSPKALGRALRRR